MQRFHLQSVDSTNDEVLRRLHAGTPPPFAIRADEQTAGRGRRGRTWFSPAGGLWMTIAWPLQAPAGVGPETAALVTGLALAEAIEPELAHRAPGPHPGSAGAEAIAPHAAAPVRRPLEIKWPNDILLYRRKVAGILCERRVSGLASGAAGSAISPSPHHDRARRSVGEEQLLIIGVGVNVNLEPADLPRQLEFPADSLRHVLGRPLSIETLFDRFLAQFAIHMARWSGSGFSPETKHAISQRLAFLEERVELMVPIGPGPRPGDFNGDAFSLPLPEASARQLCGRLLGLDERGRLLIDEDQTHTIHACHAGEVRQLRPSVG